MGRLNYSARKISGVKAGQVLSKDLKKRIPPGAGSKAAARDPTLEIDIAGKNLTDVGFAQFIDDLIECIRYRDEEHQAGLAKVTELHLQNNELTVQSLQKLSEVIVLSSGDLRELDLSRNSIIVAGPEDKKIWEGFLDAFQNCYMLKKLDLGNNPLGSAGIEILARVYIKSDLDFLETDEDDIIRSNLCHEMANIAEDTNTLKIGAEKEKENQSPGVNRNKKSPNKGKAARQNGHTHHTAAAANKIITAADLKVYACTRGLRSIPHLILSDVAITNSGAVHISNMLSFQRTPDQLLAFLPQGKSTVSPETAEGFKSIVWRPNQGLTPHATKLLEVAQSIQEVRAHIDSDSEDLDDEDGAIQRKLQSKLELEYARLTKRVRLEFLKQEGVRCSEIAFTALRMRDIARALLLDHKEREEEPPSDEEPYSQQPTAEQEEEFHINTFMDSSTVGYAEHIEFVPPYLVGPFHPSAEMFDEEFPALRMTIHKEETIHIKDTPESSANPAQRTSKGVPRHENALREIPKEKWRFGLPYELWRRIIAQSIGADGILDQEQQGRIIQYASGWDAVAYGLTIKGVETHQQIWKFLENVGCFAYTPLS